MMEWRNAADQTQTQIWKIMSDEQLELLRRQISVYATICEQLVQMHRAISAHHHFPGLRVGNPYCDPLVGSAANKISARHRWNPTTMQLHILERIYQQGHGTPTKHKIKEITTQLAYHGHISETNVYNWFQNRRARSKRKQHLQTNTTIDSISPPQLFDSPYPKDVKTRSAENSHSSFENLFYHTPDLGIEHLLGKMEPPASLAPYCLVEPYNTVVSSSPKTFMTRQ